MESASLIQSPLEQWLNNDTSEFSNDLINGKVYMQAAPSPYHSTIQGDLRAILGPLRAKKTKDGTFEKKSWYFATEVGVIYDNNNACTHDLAGWKTDRFHQVPAKGPITLGPDWVCEITSSNWVNDTIYKKEILEKAHVPFYWIISPIEKILIVMKYNNANEKLEVYKHYSMKDVSSLVEEIVPFSKLLISLQDIFNY